MVEDTSWAEGAGDAVHGDGDSPGGSPGDSLDSPGPSDSQVKAAAVDGHSRDIHTEQDFATCEAGLAAVAAAVSGVWEAPLPGRGRHYQTY